MPNLRLGAYKLPAAEVVLVQTLFRLYAHGGDFNWTFVTAPPYDALLVDGTQSDDMPTEVAHMAKSVLRLTRMHDEGGPDTLSRPIRADKLQAWLHSIEYGFQDTRPVTQMAGAPSEPPAAAAVAPPQAPVSPLRFKLRRWPPAALLRSDPNRIRMATILSRRALNATELSSISGQAVHECQAFLQTLQTTGLVEVQQEVVVPPPSAQGHTPTRAAPAATVAKPAFARGLISGIRRRLGL